jgi:hypothetical protein
MTVPTFTDANPAASNPEAPYGLKADGTPYKRDPSAYARGADHPRSGANRAKGTGPKAPGRKRAAARGTTSRGPTTQDRARRVFEFIGIPVTALGLAGQGLGSKPLVADAIVLGRAAPALAESIAEVAEQDDRIARIVDSLVQTGPYAALFGALVPTIVQIAANHSPKVAGIASAVGAQSVDDILDSATPSTNQPEE